MVAYMPNIPSITKTAMPECLNVNFTSESYE